jgi:hypothetical protein
MEFVVVGNPLNVIRRVAEWLVSVQCNSFFHEIEIKLIVSLKILIKLR